MKKRTFYSVGPLTLLLVLPAWGANWQGEVALEGRTFQQKGPAGQADSNLSLRLQLEYAQDFNNDQDRIEFIGFARGDQHDADRSHGDIRELSWQRIGSDWELRAGISKVFWGVTESRHLVDIINQTDQVENIDGEDKLGQPMLRLSLLRAWGTLELFALPYFRERTFPGTDGRFTAPLPIDSDATTYESGARRNRFDGAIRYSHSFADIDISLAHFSGTSRDPSLSYNGDLADPRLAPHYAVIDQTSLTAQYIYEGWLWKLEGLTRAGEGDRYGAVVGGLEYTQVGLWASGTDLGWVLEYLFDERKDQAPGFLEQDLFAAWRLTLNDAHSTELLAGLTWDPQSEEKIYSIKASRRLASAYKISLEGRVFSGGQPLPTNKPALLRQLASADANNKLGQLQTEDYLQLELTHYF
ncbi:hypothetical protein LRS11_21820 [Pseudomonas sp. J452]|uniref:hypothetical protein n=1 Tax=Pseudomonas sp. J452 TaxID=2898441 RepID=UPI0021ADD962|nr:hypothetical protein [Pseudomonas sp. J452]UUY08393.1 hypothetical protein LRS11_21820 [Pseudomonas sp. J452]